MSRICAVTPVLPAHSYSQHEIAAELAGLLATTSSHRAVIERTHSATGIGRRHTVLPLEQYATLSGFGEANDIFIREGAALAEKAVVAALEQAKIAPEDVDFIFFTSVTGISAPSIDALLVHRLGFRSDVKRIPSFGLGCVAGASGLARVNDLLAGHPLGVALLVSVELCSLTLQQHDTSMANFVATGLFGDGVTAVVMVGEARPEAGAHIVATRSALYPDTLDAIGWNVSSSGFEIVLSNRVGDIIEKHLPGDVARFLASNRLIPENIEHWIAHPGGPRILEAFASSLALPRQRFDASWSVLERVGNLSSSAVLHVLADVEAGGVASGDRGLLFALGPGVSAEFVLLEWP